jgi:homoserine dehydrogenase
MAATNKKLIVAVIGYTGGVGGCLLTAMKKIGLLPHALVRSSTMKIGEGASEEVPVDYGKLSSYLLQQGGIPVIADVTASSAVQENYAGWLKQGISVVAANKGIFAGSETKYRDLLAAANEGNCRLLHETTVGAGTFVATTQICFALAYSSLPCLCSFRFR